MGGCQHSSMREARSLAHPWIQMADHGPQCSVLQSLVRQMHIECLLESYTVEMYKTIKGKTIEQEGKWM